MTVKSWLQWSHRGGRRASARALLLVASLVALWAVGGAVHGQTASAPGPAYELETNVEDGFTLAAVGDLILAYPSSQRTDAGFRGVVDLIKGADVASRAFASASATRTS